MDESQFYAFIDTSQYRFSVVHQPSLSVKAWRSTRDEAQAVIDAIRKANPDMPNDELTIAEREQDAVEPREGGG